MLTVFVGVDTARAKAEVKKRAGNSALVFGEGAGEFSDVASHVQTSGLFAEALTLVLDRPSETTDGLQLIADFAKDMHASPHTIFVIEAKFDAKTKKLFPKSATIESFDPPKSTEASRPNVFSFTDTVLKGDKKGAWLGYQKLVRAGISAEEIHGALAWAVRSALLSGKTKNATEAGVKPFVYTKSKRFVEKKGIEHFEQLSRELVDTYHRARSGEGELSLGLERLLLEKV